jgi:SAM-dependent methyltransferase
MEEDKYGTMKDPMMDILDSLAACFLHNPATRSSTLDPGFKHRLNLCRAWGIETDCGLRILDIGCGQGESSIVLAQLVGPERGGHVIGVDPAPPTYGAPYTLQDSQAFALNSALGNRITFVCSTMPALLASVCQESVDAPSPSPSASSTPFDVAIFCHSLWYFPDRDTVAQQFAALAAARVPRVCLAEYTCHAGSPEQQPHELAARAQILFHRLKSETATSGVSDANVRGALEPSELVTIAQNSGWRVRGSGIISTPPDMRDGFWETQIATSSSFQDRVRFESLAKEHEDEVLAYVPRIKDVVDRLENQGKSLATMDVFWAVMELEKELPY